MLVGRLEIFPFREGAREHEDGRFWRVKISEQSVNDLEFKTRINKDVVFAFGFASFGVVFEGARDGSADGDNFVAGFFGVFNGFEGVFWNMEPFGVHVMLFDLIATDW